MFSKQTQHFFMDHMTTNSIKMEIKASWTTFYVQVCSLLWAQCKKWVVNWPMDWLQIRQGRFTINKSPTLDTWENFKTLQLSPLLCNQHWGKKKQEKITRARGRHGTSQWNWNTIEKKWYEVWESKGKHSQNSKLEFLF